VVVDAMSVQLLMWKILCFEEKVRWGRSGKSRLTILGG
jgi:hypothetical protein